MIKRSEQYTTGRMRFYVTIQKMSGTRDIIGGFSTTWGENKSVWMDIVPASSTERTQADQLVTDVTHVGYMRDADKPVGFDSAGFRVIFGAKIYAISGIVNLGNRDNWLRLNLGQEA
jgi:SPP1 family predicted phage head-tail adaptor